MTNSFLLAIILFTLIGSINNQHSICKVGDVKIESVIDISSTIKYLVTFDGTYNYWYWNEEDITNEEGQNLTSKQAFGYGNLKLIEVKVYILIMMFFRLQTFGVCFVSLIC